MYHFAAAMGIAPEPNLKKWGCIMHPHNFLPPQNGHNLLKLKMGKSRF
jgi:hypothetical protein